mmetsp:Transcript_48053/g.80739  ORF Transcript_48053/g.80739 Transcript_48053/m.80739 type:complete len:252 (-) Transcript_48053:730-1485(-)
MGPRDRSAELLPRVHAGAGARRPERRVPGDHGERGRPRHHQELHRRRLRGVLHRGHRLRGARGPALPGQKRGAHHHLRLGGHPDSVSEHRLRGPRPHRGPGLPHRGREGGQGRQRRRHRCEPTRAARGGALPGGVAAGPAHRGLQRGGPDVARGVPPDAERGAAARPAPRQGGGGQDVRGGPVGRGGRGPPLRLGLRGRAGPADAAAAVPHVRRAHQCAAAAGPDTMGSVEGKGAAEDVRQGIPGPLQGLC